MLEGQSRAPGLIFKGWYGEGPWQQSLVSSSLFLFKNKLKLDFTKDTFQEHENTYSDVLTSNAVREKRGSMSQVQFFTCNL